MKFSRFGSTALVALALAALPGMATAQQPAPEVPQEVQGWLAEMQQISGQLQELHARAMQDAELSAAHASLSEVVREAMVSADPTLEQGMQRLQELDTQAAAARQANDEARFRQLEQEAVQIQQRFAAAQQQAVQQRPELVQQMEAFQQQVETKMVELDPQAETLIQRMTELQTQLAGAMQARSQP